MQNIVVENLGGYPQKLIDLQWLENELQDINQDGYYSTFIYS